MFNELAFVGIALMVLNDEIEVEGTRGKKLHEAGREARRMKGRENDIKDAWRKFSNRPQHERAALVGSWLELSPQYVRTVIRNARKRGEIV